MKKKTRKVARNKVDPNRVLYLHVRITTKRWVNGLCKKQKGFVSKSQMVERILLAARQNKRFLAKVA